MKLLYITQMYPSEELPQYCVFLHLQVKALIRNGVGITVVIPTTEKESCQTQYDGVSVIYLHYKDYSRTALYPLVCRELKKELGRFEDVSRFDAVYAIHAPANILDFARSAAQSARKPLIVHYRGYNIFEEYHKEPKAFLSDPEKVREKVVKASALSIGVSHKTVEIITKRFPDAPVAVVYNGVDAQLFSSDASVEKHDGIRLVCVANLIPIKGHKYLFDAVKQILQKHEDLLLTTDIVGRGSYENELKSYVEENKIPGVTFHGYVGHEKVARFVQSSDIFVLPSVYESFGNVCLEAMACQKPVVIFEGQGIDELIEDGVSGMIAKKADTSDLADKIERLIDDPALRDSIAENARKTAKEYTWDASAKSIIKALEGVI